ncbi:unnamed protein product [Merluccius merluccius]
MSKGAKETIASRLGFKSGSAGVTKAELELDRVRKENAHLRRKMDDLAKRHIKPPDPDKSKLLERIISLETLRERNNQQLLVREQEMETLRQQLSARGGEVVASLQAQLEQRRRDGEQRDRSFQNQTEEMENLKNRMAAVSARCQALEGQTGAVPSGDMTVVRDQLRDALEKNQQWLVYDQQREAYVHSVCARNVELEQQLTRTNQVNPEVPEMQTHSKQLLQVLQKDLEPQREAASRARLELQQHKDQVVSEERMVSSERRGRMREELENMDTRLEEERKRSADLLQQVNLLQMSLLSQTEEQRRIATLEQQIQLSAKDFENEKLDRQSMQHQLHKVLKELRKARDQITRLETFLKVTLLCHLLFFSPKKPTNTPFSEPSLYHMPEFERLAVRDHPGPESPSKVGNLLDESFLECPKCRSSYPTSQHRELLAHLDYCLA